MYVCGCCPAPVYNNNRLLCLPCCVPLLCKHCLTAHSSLHDRPHQSHFLTCFSLATRCTWTPAELRNTRRTAFRCTERGQWCCRYCMWTFCDLCPWSSCAHSHTCSLAHLHTYTMAGQAPGTSMLVTARGRQTVWVLQEASQSPRLESIRHPECYQQS